MSGFVINDLHDIERDDQNHPNRPLPSRRITPVSAAVVYFSFLAVSLILLRAYVKREEMYLYLLLLLALVNYNYIVGYFPTLKDVYVAAVGILPIQILSSFMPLDRKYLVVSLSLFLFLLGREILMDIEDAPGDGETLAKKIGLLRAADFAFALKALGVTLLFLAARGYLDKVLVVIFLLADFWFYFLWRRNRLRKECLALMKLQLCLGIFFLI